MKADFLFDGLNLNTCVEEKTPETCTFHGWCFKKRSIKNIWMLKLGCCFPQP